MEKAYVERGVLMGRDGLFAQRGCIGRCEYCGLWSEAGCRVILEAPKADVVEVKHERCEFCEDLDRFREIVCYLPHESGHATDIPMHHCPNCGAEVDCEQSAGEA